MLSFTRTKNLRDILIRAQLPPPSHRQSSRNKTEGFKKCNYTCPVTNKTVNISTPITCTDKGVYLAFCRKDNGQCSQVAPTYVGECGEGENSSFTHRFSAHLGSATQPCQADTVKPVGRHFRLPGHEPHSDLVMIPIEKIGDKEPFLRKAREAYYIKLFSTQKKVSVFEIEHGLNIDKGK